MATRPLHIIQKQVVNITLPDIGAALAWSAEGHQEFIKMISDQLERSLSEFDGQDHLIIEKMELDLGLFTPAMLQPELPGRFHAAFREALEVHRSASPSGASHDPERRDASRHDFENDRLHAKTPDAENQTPDEPNHRLYPTRKARLESLLFFLRKGHLPWWGSGLADWDESWLEELTSTEVKDLKDFFITTDDASRSRVITQFSDAFIDRLLWRTTRQVEIIDTWLWLKGVIENLKKEQMRSPQATGSASFFEMLSSSLAVKMAALRHRYWLAWMAHAWNESATPTLEGVLNDHKECFILIRKLFQGKALIAHGVLAVKQVPVSWRAELERDGSSNEDPSAGLEREMTPEQVKDQKSANNTFPDKPDTIREVLLSRAKGETLPGKTKPAEGSPDALWVNEAGVILLHPFLPQLFRSRGWVDKENFVDAYGQTMAVYALHYLATGEAEAPEHQLLLPKLLTGMRLETVLHPVDPLTDDDRIACDELLIEVVKHWNALRNTSPDGLRQAYLRRSGKLENHDGKWRLTVEHKAQDILLSRLPWPVSIIKLPWMTGVLSVTWD
ncbi:MAG TPA: contractile injection system tape measure protein [Chryseolinea sp.]